MNAEQALRGYRIRLFLLAPALILYTAWCALRDKSWRYFCQRLGFTYPACKSTLWIHCASVGEVKAALPLIEKLSTPERQIVVTSNTTTSAILVAQKPALLHVFLPLDFTCAIRRFISALNPVAMLVMETELWPNIYTHAAQHNLPPVIVNARLSDRTLRAPEWLQQAYRCCLNVTQAVLSKSDADTERFIQMGANPEITRTIGNIKFSTTTNASTQENLIGRPYILAASTHADEEQQIALRWIAAGVDGCLLVMVPRHPQRGRNIYRQLKKLAPKTARRSLRQCITSETQIYLADTLGELDAFYAHADIVIMGGSFVPVGGHNIIEPARYGATILCGPLMYNFTTELEEMLKNHAITQLQNIDELLPTVQALLSNKLETTGINAKYWADQQMQVLNNYLSAIEELLLEKLR